MSQSPETNDALGDVPMTMEAQWVMDHLDMSIALRAYNQGISRFGETIIEQVDEAKIKLLQEKIAFESNNGAKVPLCEDEIRETLQMLPTSWLEHMQLEKIVTLKPQLFFIQKFGTHFCPGGVIDYVSDTNLISNEDTDSITQKGNIPPASCFHYAPGMYSPGNKTITLWEEPEPIQNTFSQEVLRQYCRELILHEAMHGIFMQDHSLTYVIDGTKYTYEQLMEEYFTICKQEPEAATEYSEMYQPILHAEKFDSTDFWQRTMLQEDLGELHSIHRLGWGATPEGQARTLAERNLPKKTAFIKRLSRAIVQKGDGPVERIRLKVPKP